MASRAPRNLKKQATVIYTKRADSAFRYKAFVNGVLELDLPNPNKHTPIVLTRKRRNTAANPIKPMTLLELHEWAFMELRPSTYAENRPVLRAPSKCLDFTKLDFTHV